jgi:hypothetical protein
LLPLFMDELDHWWFGFFRVLVEDDPLRVDQRQRFRAHVPVLQDATSSGRFEPREQVQARVQDLGLDINRQQMTPRW